MRVVGGSQLDLRRHFGLVPHFCPKFLSPHHTFYTRKQQKEKIRKRFFYTYRQLLTTLNIGDSDYRIYEAFETSLCSLLSEPLAP